VEESKMKTPKLWFLLAAAMLTYSGATNSEGLQYLETEDLKLLYLDPTETYLAPHAARSYENSMRMQRSIFGYEPYDRPTMLMTDFADYGNAGATPLPRNIVMVDIGPRSDMANDKDRFYRRVFGGKVMAMSDYPESIFYQYLTNPRLTSPRWYHEGIAVFTQTWMAGGLGRAQGAYDEMVFRSMVRDDAHFYDPLGLVAEGTKVDFQVGVNAYLYGTRFMSYMALQTSPDHLVKWVARTDGTRRSYGDQFEQVFGEPLEEAWQDWIDWEHEFQEKNLASVRQFPTTPYRNLSDRALGSVSRAYYDEKTNRLLAGVRYPGVVAHIAGISLEDGSVDRIEDIKGPMLFRVTSPAFDPDTRTLFFTTDNSAFRDLVTLDVDTGQSRLLIEDLRVGELVFNRSDRSIWGVRHLNGLSTLVRIPFPYDEWFAVHTFPYGENLYDMDISPDGRLLSTSHGNISGDQSLRIMEIESLLAGEVKPVKEFNFGPAVPEGFVFTPDGQFLYGSSYYTGVSNIFRYEVATGDIEAVSNAETGFFRPIPRADGSLIVFQFTGQGFVPAVIEPKPLEDVSNVAFLGTQVIEKHPELKEWQAGSPADIPLDDLITSEGTYVPRENLSLESMYPVVQGYKDSVGPGIHANFSDKIGFDRIGVTATVTPTKSNNEALHLHAKWKHQRLDQFLPGAFTTELKYNYADFYDIFGPTEIAKKGYSGEMTYDRTLIYDDPRKMNLKIRGGYYGNLDEVPYAQDVDATFESFANVNARLDYSFIRKSLGAVDDEKGFRWSAVGGSNYADSTLTPFVFGEFDYGWALPLIHSSIWLRNSGGLAIGDKDDEFSNFYFGGFRNNWVDHREIKRYREPFSLPGFDIDDLNGRTFAKSLLEWNLPPVRFRRVGTKDHYLSWARPAIFAAALITNPEDDDNEDYYDIGAQIDFQFTIMSRMDMTLSVGYAWGFEDGSNTERDFMASLKIL
jgi:hypothetical protein